MAIKHAHELYTGICEGISNPKTRRNYQALRANRRLVSLFSSLGAGSEEPEGSVSE